MPYTAAQLVAAYTAANVGVAPDAATTAVLTGYANQNATGQLTDAQTLGNVINTSDKTTAVAVQAYQFFTGKSPSKAGLDFLVNSPTNPSDLNDPYYAQFNIENRYINFAANLGLIGDGAANFASTYGSLTFGAFVAAAYEQIIGSSYATAAGINVAAAIADVISRQAAFTQTARERGLITNASTPAQIDIATKAAVVGYLLVEGIKADVGLYAAGSNNFVAALINGDPQYNVNILTTYAPLGGGVGQPVPTGGLPFVLKADTDSYPGTANNDVITGVIFSDSAATSTFNVADIINGAGGQDTLNLTVSKAAGGSTGAVAIPTTTLTSVETVNIRALSGTPTDVTTVNAASFNGTNVINSDRSISALAITNLAAGAAAGVIGDNSTTNGNLTFGYAIPASGATLNLSGGTRGTFTVGLLSPAAGMTINSTGTLANQVGAINLQAPANPTSVTTLTITAAAPLTVASIGGFASNAAITVSGTAANVAGSLTTAGRSAVQLNALDANVATLNAAGLTVGGVGATIGSNLALNFTGGAGSDNISVLGGTGGSLTGAINGGGGIDTINFLTGADLVASTASKFTSFEVVSVANLGAVGTLQSYNPTLITGATTFKVGASQGSVQLTGLSAGASVTVTGELDGTNAAGGLNLQLANASGGSDAVTLVLDNTVVPQGVFAGGTTGPAVLGAGLSLGGTTAAGQVETLNIVSSGNPGTGALLNQVNLAASGAGPNFADPNAINISGSQGLVLNTGVLGHALTVNASAMTGTGGLLFSSTAGGAFAVNVTGSSANDSIAVAANQSGTLSGGGGGDTIALAAGQQVVAFQAATDSKLDLTGVSGNSGTTTANTGGMDVVVGFTTGTDKVTLTGFPALAFAGATIADKGAAADAAAATALLATATFFQDGGAVLRKVAQFDYNGGTMLVVDTDSSGTFSAANDMVVFFAGINNIASADLI